jgi:hypothetical protein
MAALRTPDALGRTKTPVEGNAFDRGWLVRAGGGGCSSDGVWPNVDQGPAPGIRPLDGCSAASIAHEAQHVVLEPALVGLADRAGRGRCRGRQLVSYRPGCQQSPDHVIRRGEPLQRSTAFINSKSLAVVSQLRMVICL